MKDITLKDELRIYPNSSVRVEVDIPTYTRQGTYLCVGKPQCCAIVANDVVVVKKGVKTINVVIHNLAPYIHRMDKGDVVGLLVNIDYKKGEIKYEK